MTEPSSVHPLISLHFTLVFGVTLSLSLSALSLVLRLFRRLRPPDRQPRRYSRWQIDYRARSGVRFRISKTPPAASADHRRSALRRFERASRIV